MWESDDRLAGDPVWELFQPVQETRTSLPWRRWATAAAMTGVGLALCHPLAVVTVCLAVAWGDFVQARQARRLISDPWGARVSALFSCGWGLWKVGMTAFGLMFATVPFVVYAGRRDELPTAFAAAPLLWMGGFTASALVTGSGLFVAIRHDMRVWIGQGVNQARTLLLTMLIVGFTVGVLTVGVLLPLMAALVVTPAPPGPQGEAVPIFPFLFMLVCLLVGPITLLVILDAIARRVIADTPTKFGPKVAAVGKWCKPDVSQSPLDSSLKRNA